ncbi:hypothetical protein [Shouchella clausii]|uniref:hypothetical protein n=1 Tax=Shouchella clausii TaxID=79880 RepID=UPI001C735386|nr:hypothetical protein [Shouchella clausii]MBX0319784.1 hypothetical protein [Shouchella clausii]
MEYRIPIPHIYKSIALASSDPAGTYYKYVESYIRSNYPELTLIRHEKGVAVCILKEN